MKGTTRLDASSSREAANAVVRQKKQDASTASLVDNRAQTSNQLQLMTAIHGSAPAATQATQLQRMFGPTVQLEGAEEELQMKSETAQLAGPEEELQMKSETAQLAGPEEELQMKSETAQLAGPEEELQMKSETAQLAGPEEELQMKAEAPAPAAASTANAGGLPAGLKAGIESASGMDMSDVKVHRNSDKPKDLNALAYTQGSEIHVGPGQEQHLPHEAWHVVQQRQGRVAPTFQTKGVSINDDSSLEHEADVMGARAAQAKTDPDRM